MFERDPRVSVVDARPITLAGEDYLIPRLMLRQTIVIGPLMPAALRFINRRADAFKAVEKSAGKKNKPVDVATLSEHDRQSLIDAVTLTEEETGIALRIVCAGLQRLYPSVTLDALYDLPINPGELVIALPTIFAQAGTAKKAEDAPPMGEKEAASP